MLYELCFCSRNQNSIQSLCVTSLEAGCLLTRNNTNERQRKQPWDQLFYSHTQSQTHTHPIVVWPHSMPSATSQPETPSDADRLVLMWCKRVLEWIKTRLKEEEKNKEEVIFFCWWSFLLRDINAAKNKCRPLSRCAFHLRWKRNTRRENKKNVPYRAGEKCSVMQLMERTENTQGTVFTCSRETDIGWSYSKGNVLRCIQAPNKK